ncbi:unnamed protein product [Mytilus coruscus]|uniref:Uncharacterized protein n=1 Tax=Mytilus coruscus TaxID=42192 RepID=A0A6J8D2G1_MYTCO|nr:unnamed protein product [Mytilus coruscus]
MSIPNTPVYESPMVEHNRQYQQFPNMQNPNFLQASPTSSTLGFYPGAPQNTYMQPIMHSTMNPTVVDSGGKLDHLTIKIDMICEKLSNFDKLAEKLNKFDKSEMNFHRKTSLKKWTLTIDRHVHATNKTNKVSDRENSTSRNIHDPVEDPEKASTRLSAYVNDVNNVTEYDVNNIVTDICDTLTESAKATFGTSTFNKTMFKCSKNQFNKEWYNKDCKKAQREFRKSQSSNTTLPNLCCGANRACCIDDCTDDVACTCENDCTQGRVVSGACCNGKKCCTDKCNDMWCGNGGGLCNNTCGGDTFAVGKCCNGNVCCHGKLYY